MTPQPTPPAPNGHTQQQQEQQQQQTPASPSPPPPAPVPLTPGPRAVRLQQVFSQALLRTIRANSYANFAACFPTPAKRVPHSLESVWRQLNAKLEESARAEFEDVLREREVVKGLNELDRLVGEARLRRENGEGEASVPPHTLGANELYQAHLAPYLSEAQASLNTKLETVQKENAQLSEKVASQRREIEQLLSGLEAVISDVEGAAAATTEFDANHTLRKEAQEMDDEIKAAQRP
ncbi:hypothetical protein RJZ56_001061 [Blastomyces dermatitidis]|nr:MIND kinetochore complex component Nnf1 [Blastomyces dermatitidis ER-3]EEQ86482.1 MIND kinetochore complex component Nnf1 [Blastomyces dermatitidis ER-3]EQL37252.1 hypothetical protein BDFG_01510 [Blastomyces dermatitidis ATCC 26199]